MSTGHSLCLSSEQPVPTPGVVIPVSAKRREDPDQLSCLLEGEEFATPCRVREGEIIYGWGGGGGELES